MGEGAVAEVGCVFLESFGEAGRFLWWWEGRVFWGCGIEAGEGAEFERWEAAGKAEEG